MSLAVGDFNADSRLDIVTVQEGPGGLSLVMNRGGGELAGAVMYGHFSAHSLALADFNGDGKPDVVTVPGESGGLRFLTSAADGSMVETTRYEDLFDCAYFSVVAAADIDRDGRADVVVDDACGTSLALLAGDGHGGFTAPRWYEVGGSVRLLALADLNDDSIPDALAVLHDDDDRAIRVMLGRPDGSLAAPIVVSVGYTPESSALGDFNKDGLIDLVTARPGDTLDPADHGRVAILFGLGDGSFSAARSLSVGPNPASVVAADFTGDGLLDLATASPGPSVVTVAPGNGDGSFREELRFTGALWIEQIAVGDFNGDGRMDLAGTQLLNNSVVVLSNTCPALNTP